MWFGMSRREENHMKWEDKRPYEAVTMKAGHAREKGIEKQQKRKSQRRKQRNNRREY